MFDLRIHKGRFDSNLTRHSSPVHFHITRDNQRKLIIRIVVFPANRLPDIETSREFLGKFLDYLRDDLTKRVKEHAKKGQHLPPMPPPAMSKQSGASKEIPSVGDTVKARLLEEKTKKGGWKVELSELNIICHIINSPDVPSDKKAGDEIDTIVAFIDSGDKTGAVKYPVPGSAANKKPQPRPGGGKQKDKSKRKRRNR